MLLKFKSVWNISFSVKINLLTLSAIAKLSDNLLRHNKKEATQGGVCASQNRIFVYKHHHLLSLSAAFHAGEWGSCSAAGAFPARRDLVTT